MGIALSLIVGARQRSRIVAASNGMQTRDESLSAYP
eukprot:SAG31_NODE_38159_length_298_cov_1.040201_1_plen_35_part_01